MYPDMSPSEHRICFRVCTLSNMSKLDHKETPTTITFDYNKSLCLIY